MSKVELLHDSNRFYIAINSPTAEDIKKAMSLVQEYFGYEIPNVEIEKPEGVLPNRVEEYIPTEAKKIHSVDEVIEPQGKFRFIPELSSPEMFIEYYLQYHQLDAESKRWLIIKCARFMKKHLMTVDIKDVNSVKNFLISFQSVMVNSVDEVLKLKGYTDFYGFISKADEKEILYMFECCKASICKGLKIN